MEPGEPREPGNEQEEPAESSSPPVSDPRLRETAEADADDPSMGGSSDGDTGS